MRLIPDPSKSVRWRKSSYSNGQGAECVEVADGLAGVLPVRDSKDPSGAVLVFPARDWDSFISAIKGGSFIGS